MDSPRRSRDYRRDAAADLWWAGWQFEIILYTERLQASSKDSVGSDWESDISLLRAEIHNSEIELRESRSQRAVLESVISERLESERHAVSLVSGMRDALQRATVRVNELSRELSAERILRKDAAIYSKELGRKLADVETFMGSEDGSYVLRLETELAAAKVRTMIYCVMCTHVLLLLMLNKVLLFALII